jgi:hypothetical protein
LGEGNEALLLKKKGAGEYQTNSNGGAFYKIPDQHSSELSRSKPGKSEKPS